MLVLTRQIGEEIVIAGNIRVAVLKVEGKTVRLGITASSSVSVLRRELLSADSESIELSASSRKPGKSDPPKESP